MFFRVITIGCKVNQYESQALAELLCQRGLLRHGVALSAAGGQCSAGPVSLVVVNTCCVTAAAEAKTRLAIRRAVTRNPGANLLIAGCAAALKGRQLEETARRAGCTGRVFLAGHDQDIAAVATLAADASMPEPAAETPLRRQNSLQVAGNEECMRAGTADIPVACSPSSTPVISTTCDSNVKSAGADTPVKSTTSDQASATKRPVHKLPAIRDFEDHQRAFVKVQDGCDAFCSYCTVPAARKTIVSRSADEVIAEVHGLLWAGFPEIVLCGVCLGAYGQQTTVRSRWRDDGQLPGLIDQLAQITGLRRLRLSSLHPGDVTPALAEVFASHGNCAPHFHLPLQSGSDAVLRKMNRQYDAAGFLAAARLLRDKLDAPAITTDVIVGFPGESDSEFAATLDVCRQAAFSKIHIFPFSARPDTPAWAWRKLTPSPQTVNARIRRLADLESEFSLSYRRQFLGRRVEVVVEKPTRHTPPGQAHGLTDRYIDVEFPSAAPPRSVVTVEITALSPTGLTGRCL